MVGESSGDNDDAVGDEVEVNDESKAPRNRRVGVPANFLSRSVLPDLSAVLAQRDELARVMSAVATNLGVLDVLRNAPLIDSFRLQALEASEAMSRIALGPSMLPANLAAQLAEIRLTSVLKDFDFGAVGRVHADVVAQVDSVRRVAGLVEQQNSVLAALRPQVDVARSVAFATQAWDDVIRVSTPERAPNFLERLQVAGRGTGWVVQAGLLLTEPNDEHLEHHQEKAAAVLGPAEASAEVRERLAEVHPSLSERLDGAWERISNGGADAASQAANSLMETVDWTLRTLAPNEEVLAWHASEKRSIKELHEGKPNRALRIRYVVRAQPEKNSALDLYLKALRELVCAVQAPKHAIELHSPRALVPIALSVEGLLHLLLVD
ncbi:MAG: hypothetical protein QOI95_1844 [Acidimicrobiaceae bacterium]